MSIQSKFIFWLSERWSRYEGHKKLGNYFEDKEQYALKYSWEQFNYKVRKGFVMDVKDKEVLDIGCGHGGNSCFIALNGAKRVTGIDINLKNMKHAQMFAELIAKRFGDDARLPIDFVEMNAYEMTFEPNSFDIVIADNAFEHFTQPKKVMEQCHKVLRPGGVIYAPIFSSIYSKYGLHLKNGLKVPWLNLFFSEKTIIEALRLRAEKYPELHESYPNLKNNPKTVAELRTYGDLNDITYRKFKKMARESGFRVKWFRYYPTPFGRIVNRIPFIKHGFWSDVFSTGAGSILEKKA